MYFLDTTAIIELFRGNENLKTALDRIGNEGAVTSISYFEIFTRIFHRQLKEEKAYFTRFFSSVPVYDFGIKAAEESSRLMSSLYKIGVPINLADVMIAGISAANGADGIITKDRDFESVRKVSELDIIFI